MRALLYLVMVVLFLTLSGGPAGAMDSRFAPHRAIYDIKLTSTKSGSQILNITGQMLYEWQPSCDAWMANHRFNLFYEYADSPPIRILSDFTTYEPFDGKSLNFSSQRRRGSEPFEDIRGNATLDSGQAVFSKPSGLSYDLPPGTLFPMTHTLKVMDAAAAGQTFVNAVVFDGSDEDGPVEINAFIGKPADSAAFKGKKSIDETLLAAPAHHARLAFFPVKDGGESSDYEMNLIFHNNGVISNMAIEYRDFSVQQTLIALEPMASACEKAP